MNIIEAFEAFPIEAYLIPLVLMWGFVLAMILRDWIKEKRGREKVKQSLESLPNEVEE